MKKREFYTMFNEPKAKNLRGIKKVEGYSIDDRIFAYQDLEFGAFWWAVDFRSGLGITKFKTLKELKTNMSEIYAKLEGFIKQNGNIYEGICHDFNDMIGKEQKEQKDNHIHE